MNRVKDRDVRKRSDSEGQREDAARTPPPPSPQKTPPLTHPHLCFLHLKKGHTFINRTELWFFFFFFFFEGDFFFFYPEISGSLGCEDAPPGEEWVSQHPLWNKFLP